MFKYVYKGYIETQDEKRFTPDFFFQILWLSNHSDNFHVTSGSINKNTES